MAQDYTTMRVPTDAYEAAKTEKRDGETWGDYIQRCTDNPPEIREFVDADSVATDRQAQLEEVVHGATCDVATTEDVKDLSVLVDQLTHRVERIEEAMQ